MKRLIYAHIVVFLLFYVFAVIIAGEYDIFSWDKGERIGYVFFSEMFSLVGALMYTIIKESA